MTHFYKTFYTDNMFNPVTQKQRYLHHLVHFHNKSLFIICQTKLLYINIDDHLIYISTYTSNLPCFIWCVVALINENLENKNQLQVINSVIYFQCINCTTMILTMYLIWHLDVSKKTFNSSSTFERKRFCSKYTTFIVQIVCKVVIPFHILRLRWNFLKSFSKFVYYWRMLIYHEFSNFYLNHAALADINLRVFSCGLLTSID